MVKRNSFITCHRHCFCFRFIVPTRQRTRLRKELFSEKYKKSFLNEIKKTKVKVKLDLVWGRPRKGKGLEPQKRLLGVALIPENSLPYKDLYKTFPIIQRRMEKLTQYGVKEFETTVCTTLGFSLKAFKPVGQLSLPAKLPLTPELKETLGEPLLKGFRMRFVNSPLGLEEAIIELEEEERELLVTLNSGFKSKSLKKIVVNVYEHVIEIAKLFVVKKE